MTFFIDGKITMPRRGPNVALPDNSDGIGAGFRTALRSADQYLNYNRAQRQEATPLAETAGNRIGVQGLNEYFVKNNPNLGASPPPAGETVQDFIDWYGPDMVLDAARERAKADPAAWADMDFSQEAIDAKAIERQKAEEAADQELLALSPNPIRNALVGGLGAGVVDPINILAAPLGLGPGSFLRVVGREAAINASIEAVQFPTRAKVAERLDQEAPSFIGSVAMGAAVGGVFAGVLDGLPRALRGIAYYREMKKVQADPTIRPETQEAGIQAAERAIAEGGNPMKAVQDAVLAEPPPARRPLILDDSMRVPEPMPLAPDPITTQPLEPVPGVPNTVEQIEAVATGGIRKGAAPAKPRKEAIAWLKKRGGVDPNGWLGEQLKVRGLSNKTDRGLFKKGGERELDNIPFDDVDPALSWRVGKAEDELYLDREAFLRVLDEEMRPDRMPKEYGRDYVPERAWSDPDPEERGLLVNDLDARQFAEPDTWRETLAADVDRYLESKGYTLLPRERDEILQVAGTRGGDVEDLVYSAMSREIDEAEQATVRAMRGEAYGRTSEVPWGEEARMGDVPDRAGGDAPGKPQAAGGDAAQPGARGAEPAVERTDIGDQYVIPGAERVAPDTRARDKAEIEVRQLQSKIRRLNQARVEDDVDGLFAARTVDLFDDLNSPEAQSYMDANIQAMRDMLEDEPIAGGDFNAVADDGRALGSLSDILDEIDDEATLMREFNLCRLGGGTTE